MHARVLRYVAALICTLLCLLDFTTADVAFTAPSAGANVTPGLIKVQWKDSGISPPISELTQFTLSLMTGGNEDGEMLPLTTFESQGVFNSDNTAQGTIPSGIAAGIENGFFFRMTSTKEAGGIVINYSSRFSINGLTGATPLQYRQAAMALDGSTKGPAAVGDSSSSTLSSAADSSTQSSSMSISSQSTIAGSGLSGSSSTSHQASITQTPAPSSNPSSTSTSRSGLSTGAIAGIAAGATALGLIIIGAIIAFLCIRRRRTRRQVQEIDPPRKPFLDGKAELSSEEIKPPRLRSRVTELSTDSMVVEAGSGEPPAELDHMAFRAELEGSAPPSPYTTMHEKGFC